MSGIVAFEGELNAIVNEYLEFNHMDKVSTIFQEECSAKGKSIQPYKNNVIFKKTEEKLKETFINKFNKGERNSFFDLWRESIPKQIQNEDSVAQKLEFYLNIYFAIFSYKYNSEDAHKKEDGMQQFKIYLESRGSKLSQTTEFLPFYALPFVPNPSSHPSYKELFSDHWIPDLKIRLEKFLILALKTQNQPTLFEIYKSSRSTANIDEMKILLSEAQRKAAINTKRYQRFQNDYHNLIGITADLVDTLERTIQGQQVSPEYIQTICNKLFSNQVRQSIDVSRPGTAGTLLRQSVIPPQGLDHNQTNLGHSFDYKKIKMTLAVGSDLEKGLLLQALRWKLTKSSPANRDACLSDYLLNDLLGCKEDGEQRESMMAAMLSDSELVRQYLARLYNTLASLSDGRSYLASNPKLMHSLMENLQNESHDSLTRENVLGCLQKLSLKRQLQTMMIDEGIIAWLVNVLEDDDALSDYTLEYSVALMMNLCLRTSGKKKCVYEAKKVLHVLSNLLGHENKEIIPYVNGSLYSILAIPSIREEARAMDMQDILQCYVKSGQPEMNRQIEFIIKQLNSEEEPDVTESDDEDEDEDEEDADALEADLDKQELLKPSHCELYGDRLLNTNYTLSNSPVNRKKRQVDSVMEEPLRRPITPSQRRVENPVVPNVHTKSRIDSVSSEAQIPPRSPKSSARSSAKSQREINRPPTRSGSRPNSSKERSLPPTPLLPTDEDASKKLSSIIGYNKNLTLAENSEKVKPSEKVLNKLSNNSNLDEYSMAFSSRPRVIRSSDGHPDAPRPAPKFSETLPISRPSSGNKS